jgi:3D-(3,5/4)-trihydroxycyclohexane-1,2-dione acylhydrolase (decyclizing)
LTVAQATIRFLKQQYSERDGVKQKFFAGCFGIFGHGNLAGLGQALQQNSDFTYYQSRNEQAMVLTAAAYARAKNRLQTFVCTSSIGPGATNMVTGAALATINRLPVLLLPGDLFATRTVAPVLQQLESEHSQDISVNDCFKPVSRYWDRINRPEQLLTSLPEAMRVLMSPAETGAVVLAMPQDVQAEAYNFPKSFFEERVWSVPRLRADQSNLRKAAEWISECKKPLIVAGGGTIYSEATEMLSRFADASGIAVAETQAGKGSLHWEHPLSLGAIGVTGTPGANLMARDADLVIGIGTRYSDFTTMSKTAFQNEHVRFININVSAFDSYKHNALALTGDAKVTLQELLPLVKKQTSLHYKANIIAHHGDWDKEVYAIYEPGKRTSETLSQGEVIGIVNNACGPKDVVVAAAGSLPGDLHKLWRTRDPKGYHVEYGYSCMGYEIAGGLGVKMAQPDREVFVMVGDGSYLMMAQEIVTAVQERIKLIIILIDNHGFGSIGNLSRSLGCEGFGTAYRYRSKDGQLTGDYLPTDFAANATSFGAQVLSANTRSQLLGALEKAKQDSRLTLVVVPTDATVQVPGYEPWWNVPVPEVSTMSSVQAAREIYETAKRQEQPYFKPAYEQAKVKEPAQS